MSILKEQIRTYREISEQIRQLEHKKKALGNAILQQMEGKVMHVEDSVVRHYRRLSIKLSIDQARALDATKMEEMIDKEKIRSLYDSGEQIEGVSEIEWIQVTAAKRREELPSGDLDLETGLFTPNE